MMRAKCIAVWLIAFALLTLASSARGQSIAANPAATESEEDRLAEEVDDPTAILTQLKFQDLYTPRNFQTPAQTNQIDLKVVLPLEPFWLLPFKQIIRPTLKVQTIAISQSSSSTITEFADMELLDLLVSDWPDPAKTGFGWGIGPTFVFPTGRVPKAGQHAWQAGPAAAAAYRGIPHLMAGFLFQNPISFSYTLGHGWYVKSADSTWTVNLRHGSSTTIPISLGFGRVWKFEGPELNTWVSGEWTAYRQYTNITPMYTVRFGLTLLFP